MEYSSAEPSFRDALALAVDDYEPCAVLALLDSQTPNHPALDEASRHNSVLLTSAALDCEPPFQWPQSTVEWLADIGEGAVVPRLGDVAGWNELAAFGHATAVVVFDAEGEPCGMLATLSTSGSGATLETESQSARRQERLTILAGQVERVLDLRREHSVLREVSLGLKANEQTLTTQVAQLEGANRELDHYADFAAHELRSPLRSALMVLDLLGRELDGPPEDFDRERVTYYLEQVRSGAEVMWGQLDGLLQLAQLTGEAPESTWVKLGKVVDRIASMHRAELSEAGARLEADEATRATDLFIDPLHLHHILANTVSNALRYRDQDRSLVITISAETEPAQSSFDMGAVTVSVADNARGIAPEDHDRIFAMFGRVNHDVEGAGLGLALCQRLARLYGGTMGVESTFGVGSTFWTRFPVPKKTYGNQAANLVSTAQP